MAFQFEDVQRWVYVLELEDDNYYVGQTDDLEKRIKKHGTKKGAQWTQIYKPISTIHKIDAGICTEFEAFKKENEITILMMNKYGWEKVRGGDFSSPNELTIYNQLVKAIDKYNILFELKKPESVKEKHKLKIYKGMNRSKEKLNILQDLDNKTRATILASISAVFNSKTSKYSLTELENLDCETLCDNWLQKNENKYSLDKIHSEELLKQIKKLKADKIVRLKKNLLQ
ncbi:GIY-YIG nuclease family protein [Aquibacillus saliphilus]|uniref:GIY-YIG nuclease family protein n=1 Tax=Aquibacillus saliphilus TaxID=1909422 RepID=UPI001CF0CCA5|nr:GIY-YIG nuclease family protein [Aquibacillus saliphilus]